MSPRLLLWPHPSNTARQQQHLYVRQFLSLSVCLSVDLDGCSSKKVFFIYFLVLSSASMNWQVTTATTTDTSFTTTPASITSCLLAYSSQALPYSIKWTWSRFERCEKLFIKLNRTIFTLFFFLDLLRGIYPYIYIYHIKLCIFLWVCLGHPDLFLCCCWGVPLPIFIFFWFAGCLSVCPSVSLNRLSVCRTHKKLQPEQTSKTLWWGVK